MTPEEAAEKQRAYRKRRRLYAWRHGRPYRQDIGKPEPATLDHIDPELG